VVVPESTPDYMRKLIESYGAELLVRGKVWAEANEAALQIIANKPGSAYIHPFDDPDIWEGHSTLIDEIFEDPKMQTKPSAIITVVGGGGLLVGLLQGLHKIGWGDVPIVACETEGADSFAQAAKKGELVTLPAITSIAKSLGASTVCKEALNWSKKHKISSVVLSDALAVDAIIRFTYDHHVLVEPACGVGLAAVYQKVPQLTDLLKNLKKPGPVVVIVCGGSMVTFQSLQEWKVKFEL